MNKIEKLVDYLTDKDIALVGNAKSILKTKKDIDKHEVIIRMNNGSPKDKEEFMGSRTDVLALSLGLERNFLKVEFDPRWIFWCTPRTELMPTYMLVENWCRYPIKLWDMLQFNLKARPSTGCMTFDFLMQKVSFKSVTLYGFDFWKSPNWYTNVIHLGEHKPTEEEEYIRFFTKFEGIKIYEG